MSWNTKPYKSVYFDLSEYSYDQLCDSFGIASTIEAGYFSN